MIFFFVAVAIGICLNICRYNWHSSPSKWFIILQNDARSFHSLENHKTEAPYTYPNGKWEDYGPIILKIILSDCVDRLSRWHPSWTYLLGFVSFPLHYGHNCDLLLITSTQQRWRMCVITFTLATMLGSRDQHAVTPSHQDLTAHEDMKPPDLPLKGTEFCRYELILLWLNLTRDPDCSLERP